MRIFTTLQILWFANICSPVVQAGFVDFETIPGMGTPTQGQLIGNQFLNTQGIQFQLADGSRPVIAQVGDPTIGFVSGLGAI